jgi:hypothetical protein
LNDRILNAKKLCDFVCHIERLRGKFT